LDNLQSVETYLANKNVRQDFAGFYIEVKNIGDGFPDTKYFSYAVKEILMKSVSDSCHSCVKTSKMKSTIETALLHLRAYWKELIINDVKDNQDQSKKIHDLRPNI